MQYARIFCEHVSNVLHFEFGNENSADNTYFTIYIPLTTSWSFTFSDAVTAVSKSVELSTLSSESLSGITRGDSVLSNSPWNLKLIFFSIKDNTCNTFVTLEPPKYRVSHQLVLNFDFNSWFFWLSYQKNISCKENPNC